MSEWIDADGAGRDEPTHAGGVVWRREQNVLRFLLVRPLDGSDVWVLPKGHIEPGETTAQAAVREVLEEAGAQAELGPEVGRVSYAVGSKRVNCVFFLLRWVADTAAAEERPCRWAALEEVRELIPFPATVAVIVGAAESLAF